MCFLESECPFSLSQLVCSLFTIALAGVIHDAEPIEAETDHHLKIDHEHAQSHQSFKIHHFHAVPVYVKHEDQHFLKNPVEVGGVKHKLKVINVHIMSRQQNAPLHFREFQVLHPKTEHSHSHGLTLENHTEEKDNRLHGYEQYGGLESSNNYRTAEGHETEGAEEQADYSQHQFQDINVHHGHEWSNILPALN